MSKQNLSTKMRVYHRYLGYFLAGIMAVYAVSGVIMIFRDTDFLKIEKQVQRKTKPNITIENLGRELRIRDLKVTGENGKIISFQQGTYNKETGEVNYTTKEWPDAINKLANLHKASTKEPLFYLNVFFGLSLLFFVVSAFWMFLPKTTIFKKGMYFAAAGIALTLILIFL
ncbi:MAG TPA: hypothetical protein VMT76_08610 [Puia sp.]|nr:hypothetical protein [Puia sp.]